MSFEATLGKVGSSVELITALRISSFFMITLGEGFHQVLMAAGALILLYPEKCNRIKALVVFVEKPGVGFRNHRTLTELLGKQSPGHVDPLLCRDARLKRFACFRVSAGLTAEVFEYQGFPLFEDILGGKRNLAFSIRGIKGEGGNRHTGDMAV